MSIKQLVEDWSGYLRELKNRPFEASAHFSKYHRRTGIPLVALAALANTGLWAILTDINPNIEIWIKVLLALLGTVITVLSAVQAFLGFDKRSEMHKAAADKYSALGADVEILLNSEQEPKDTELREIKDKWSVITENAPVLPEDNSLTNPSSRRGIPAVEG